MNRPSQHCLDSASASRSARRARAAPLFAPPPRCCPSSPCDVLDHSFCPRSSALTCSPPQAFTAACSGCSGARAHKSHIVASFSLKRPVLSSRRLQSGCATHELQRMQLPGTRPLPPPHAPSSCRTPVPRLHPRVALGATFANERSSVRFTS